MPGNELEEGYLLAARAFEGGSYLTSTDWLEETKEFLMNLLNEGRTSYRSDAKLVLARVKRIEPTEDDRAQDVVAKFAVLEWHPLQYESGRWHEPFNLLKTPGWPSYIYLSGNE